MADETIKPRDDIFWVAPIRHNPTYFENTELEEHYNYVKQIASFLGKENATQMTSFFIRQGYKFPKFNAGKSGIVTLFKQTSENLTLDELINDISEALLSSEPHIIRSFLVGLFDGRGSYDNSSFITLDYWNENLGSLVIKLFDLFNLDYNINNTLTARQRQDSTAKPRRGQLRVKHLGYLGKIGVISPNRFKRFTAKIEKYQIIKDNVLPGLKKVSFI